MLDHLRSYSTLTFGADRQGQLVKLPCHNYMSSYIILELLIPSLAMQLGQYAVSRLVIHFDSIHHEPNFNAYNIYNIILTRQSQGTILNDRTVALAKRIS